MVDLKNYDNIYRLYARGRNKSMICFFVSLFVVIFSFFMMLFAEDGWFDFVMIVMIAAIVCLVIFAILWPVRCHGAKKQVSVFTPQQLTSINYEMAFNQKYDHFIVTSQAVVNDSGILGLVPVANILWIYKEVTTTRMYGLIPVSKSSVLVIRSRDKRKYTVNIKNDSQVINFLQSELQKYKSDIIYGYSPELLNLYNNDINQLIAVAASQQQFYNGQY